MPIHQEIPSCLFLMLRIQISFQNIVCRRSWDNGWKLFDSVPEVCNAYNIICVTVYVKSATRIIPYVWHSIKHWSHVCFRHHMGCPSCAFLIFSFRPYVTKLEVSVWLRSLSVCLTQSYSDFIKRTVKKQNLLLKQKPVTPPVNYLKHFSVFFIWLIRQS